MKQLFGTAFPSRLRDFWQQDRAMVSVEVVFAIPIMIAALIATTVVFDVYRARTQAEIAAFQVADLISRNSNVITTDYLEGMNDVFDFLTTRNLETRLRISVMQVTEETSDLELLWSHGTRGLVNLHDMGAVADTPVGARLPTVLVNEPMIVVESFVSWTSPVAAFSNMPFLNDIILTPVAVARPRFSPFIRFTEAQEVFPESPPELLPEVGEPEAPTPPEEEPAPPPPAGPVTIVDTNFSAGAPAGWSVTPINTGSFGNFLGPFGRETRQNPVTYAVNLGAMSRSARIEFDLFIIDSWDGYDFRWARPEGEHLMLQVNGSSIATEAFQGNPAGIMAAPRRTVTSRAEGVFTTTMQPVQTNSNLWGSGWNDQVWRVVIEVENPTQAFTLGFSANLDEDINNESFGLKNFRITAERGEHGPAHFVPDQPGMGTDPYNGFPRFAGCPDDRIAAQSHVLSNTALRASGHALRHRVSAGGTTDLRNCMSLQSNERGFVNAAPHLVLTWDNENRRDSGNRLRIRTDDGDRGFTCDAVLVVRDPFGQLVYNGWISWRNRSSDNYNAQLNLGNAASGAYHIWVGSWTNSYCNTDIVIELY